MIKLFKYKKMYKRLLAIGISIYVGYIFFNQQKILNLYENRKKYFANQIKEQKAYNKDLLSLKENTNSPEYIEEIAREKLDMYLPNEKVYIDVGN